MVGFTLHMTVTHSIRKSIGSSKVDTENARVHAIQHSDLISLKEGKKRLFFFSTNAFKDVLNSFDLLSWKRMMLKINQKGSGGS
jgi:hypothetical protein